MKTNDELVVEVLGRLKPQLTRHEWFTLGPVFEPALRELIAAVRAERPSPLGHLDMLMVDWLKEIADYIDNLLARADSRGKRLREIADAIERTLQSQDAPQTPETAPSSEVAPTDNEIVDFLVAYHGYPDRATAFRMVTEQIFDEAKLIQSWATLRPSKAEAAPAKSQDPASYPIRGTIQHLALKFHRQVEGETGCPGLTCPGVQRLIEHFFAAVGIGIREDLRPSRLAALGIPVLKPWSCDRNAAAYIKRLEAEVSRLTIEKDEYRCGTWHVDTHPVSRLQLPTEDGGVPGNDYEALTHWHRIACEALAEVSRLKAKEERQ